MEFPYYIFLHLKFSIIFKFTQIKVQTIFDKPSPFRCRKKSRISRVMDNRITFTWKVFKRFPKISDGCRVTDNENCLYFHIKFHLEFPQNFFWIYKFLYILVHENASISTWNLRKKLKFNIIKKLILREFLEFLNDFHEHYCVNKLFSVVIFSKITWKFSWKFLFHGKFI